ncbi:hypothetical protein PCASD_04368 [Puccinia coronata f. sp. avenae]|uniref:F-box domain-containing protein n=1 Tax=Puccinia coronata f. sp. avenae TaxID=200324 RepID=A0A2N5VCY8_9BASI|nr:hypothetical protein PCASD_04368 [Puccinia coronata f. sp. avenae]
MQTEKRECSDTHKPLPLGLVNRSFYELCSPFNWGELDLIFQDAPCLELLIQQLLPRQANQVKSIAIGLHHDSDELFPAKQLRQILEICTNLTKLSVRLESARLNEHGNFIIDPWHPISRLLDPISQLSNLTHLTLLNYNNNCVLLDEEFVVKIIKRMVHLVYIRLDRVDATNATCDFCDCEASNQPNLSPLAVHLASLSSLKFIYFTAMPCFDSGWSKIKWKALSSPFNTKTLCVQRILNATYFVYPI